MVTAKDLEREKEALLERKREAVRDFGEDSLEVQLIYEELTAVNYALGYFKQGSRRGKERYNRVRKKSVERQLYEKWTYGENTNEDDRRKMLEVLERGKKFLTPHQTELMTMRYSKGMKVAEIAEQVGINKSTVSRTIKRAEGKLKRVAKENLIAGLMEEHVSLREMRKDPELREKMLRVLTETQRRYFELYYFHGISMADIADRFGIEKSTVSRTVGRANGKLARTFKYEVPKRVRKERRVCKKSVRD